MDGDPLFDSANAALAFAYNFEGRPETSSMVPASDDRSKLPSKGLGGLDGSAQAGMIKAEVNALDRFYGFILAAKFAQHHKPCACKAPCCSGFTANWEWREAIGLISMAPIIVTATFNCMSNNRLRRGIVERYFKEPVKLKELAIHAGVNADTASLHNERIVKILRESERKAMDAIRERLHAAGMV